MKIRTILIVAAAGAALASCMSDGPRPMPVSINPAPQANGVEGSWSDPNGLNSTFSSGQFVTRTTDGTNTQLASGTYTSGPNGMIQINLYSNVKRTTSLVNCAMVNSSQLNCTSDAGSQFSLTRRM